MFKVALENYINFKGGPCVWKMNAENAEKKQNKTEEVSPKNDTTLEMFFYSFALIQWCFL